MLFRYTYYQFKKLALYFSILIALLIFNYYYYLYYNWNGVAVIVRMYLFVFSFFLIYNYTSEEEEKYYRWYQEKWGTLGKVLFVIESRYFLFIIIYLFSALFTVTYYSGSENWPISPILALFDGRYSNTVFYCLAFFISLTLRRHLLLTVTFFLGLAFSYYMFDHTFYNYYQYGIAISIYKIVKMVVLFYIPGFDYAPGVIKKIFLFIFSIILAFMVYFFNIGIFFMNIDSGYYNNYASNYSAEKLLKFGIDSHYESMKNYVILSGNMKTLLTYYKYCKSKNMLLYYSSSEWATILKRVERNAEIIDIVSAVIIYDRKTVNSGVIDLLYNDVFLKDAEVSSYTNFIQLMALSVDDVEKYFKNVKFLNNEKKHFVFKLFAYSGKVEMIPVILDFLFSTDEKLSIEAYNSLVMITGIDPVKNGNPRRSVETYLIFKDYYLDEK